MVLRLVPIQWCIVLASVIELDERLSLLITVFVLGLVFGSQYLIYGLLLHYLIITLIASIAVIPHELAHRWSARRMGCYSRYVLSPFGLLLTLITAIPFIPFKIIMPGFTLVIPTTYDPRFLKRLNGVVSYMGPLTNMLIASLSLALYALLIKIGVIHPILWFTLLFNTLLNAWVAIFNLLPVPPLDGSKIITWKPSIWIVSLLFSIGLYIIARYLLGV